MLNQILKDEALGAGNFIYKLSQYFDTQQPLLHLFEQKSLSIADIIQISDRLASAYDALGVKPKDVVSLYLQDSFDYFLHFVALNSMGAIPSLINGGLSDDVLEKFLAIIKPDFLVVNRPTSISHLPVFNLNDIDHHATGERPPLFEHQPDDVIMIGHTSGTTGIPKGVIFTHESMYYGVKQQIEKQKGEHVLSILPHSHGASISVLMSFLLRGTPMTLLSEREPDAIIHAVKKIKPDVVVAFPKVFVDLCREQFDPEDFESVSYWIATGDANHEPHIRKLVSLGHHQKKGQRVAGSCFIDNLGSSEFAFAIFRNIHTPNTNKYQRCIGQAFDWVDVAVFDDEGQKLPANQIGRLGVKAKSVTQGYWNNHSLTEKNKLQGYWLTGDLVYFDDQGDFYHVDRTSDAIMLDSKQVYSCQMEELILAHMPEIFELSIVEHHNQLIAYVELQAETSDLLPRMNAHMQQHGYPTFSTLEFQSAHDYTGVTGKKLKRTLRTL